MALFVLDRIGFLKSGEYKFRELPNGEFKAKAWLEVNNPNWVWYMEDQKTQDQLEYLLGKKQLPWERKQVLRPYSAPKMRH